MVPPPPVVVDGPLPPEILDTLLVVMEVALEVEGTVVAVPPTPTQT